MNIVKGSIITWTEPVFTGTYPRSKYSHDRTIKGKVIKESYGSLRGQHTFTIEVIASTDNQIFEGDKIRRKGRNIYSTAIVEHQPEDYETIANEKKQRAEEAKESKYITWINEYEFERKGKHKIQKIPKSFIDKNSELLRQNYPFTYVELFK